MRGANALVPLRAPHVPVLDPGILQRQTDRCAPAEILDEGCTVGVGVDDVHGDRQNPSPEASPFRMARSVWMMFMETVRIWMVANYLRLH